MTNISRTRGLLAASILGSLAALSTLSTRATAQDGSAASALRVRSLAASCAQCHGTDGLGVEGAVVPGLVGLPPATFIERMKAYKSGERAGTVMPQLAKGFDDAQIAQLAEYFAGPAAAIKH